MEEEQIPRLLLVEPSSADLYIFDYYLYPHFEVFAAENGGEAIELLKRMPFDCVLVSAELPDCYAKDLIGTIQTHFGPAPIVLLTDLEADITKTITPINGVSTCINKELVTNDQLLRELWEVMEHSPVLCSMLHPQ